jgi:urease accessory protein
VSALLRLINLLSPAFPTGSFAFSHGLEREVHDGHVATRAALEAWLADLLADGSLWNDAVLCAESFRRAKVGRDLDELAALGLALAGSRERFAETLEQGVAFARSIKAWPGSPDLPERLPYPVAVGAAAEAHSIALSDALAAYLNAVASGLVQAGIRLIPIGQSEAVAALAALEPVILAAASRAANSSLEDLGSTSVRAEIAGLRHETQYSRLFRS